jgi:hypothetical protein
MAPETRTDSFRAPRAIFWTGLLLRVLYLTLAHTYRIRLFEDHFQFGWEMGRIARALATGFGYADPFTGHTGPTAWLPPLYPVVLAGIFKLFGVYTPLSAWVILTLNSIVSAATAPAIYEIAKRCYKDEKLALWSAWLWALYPAAMQYAVHWVWDMAPTAFFFAWTLVLALRLRNIGSEEADPQTTRRWLAFGLLWGLIALTNATPLVFLPVCGVWILVGAWKTPAFASSFGKAILAGLVFCACLAPWMIRNYTVFHALIPMRGNLGAELHESILEEHMGFPWGATVPIADHDPTYLKYKRMGEFAYVQQQDVIAKQYIATHKTRFLQLALKRVYFYWVSVPHPIEPGFKGYFVEITREINFCFLSLTGILGLALSLRNRIPGATLFVWAFLLMPFAYYFITVQARFRHPLEPLITIFTVYLFRSATTRRKPVPLS